MCCKQRHLVANVTRKNVKKKRGVYHMCLTHVTLHQTNYNANVIVDNIVWQIINLVW